MTMPAKGSRYTSSRVTTSWTDKEAPMPYSTGVSLHSHTSVSEETLSFVHAMLMAVPGLQSIFAAYCRKARHYGIEFDFHRANWRPPLQPRMAYEVESRQIMRLNLNPLVSITDHDTIEAPMLLRTVPSSRHIPVSLEWSAPYGRTTFHLGIHNLPSSEGTAWMQRFAAFTALAEKGTSPGTDRKLLDILRDLNASPQVLTVFNHPLWDLHKSGPAHLAEVSRFIAEAGRCIHAIELNGLRHARENRAAAKLARETGHVLLSGGDRHGLEPNANINLTSAASFTEFVQEVRVDRVSHVHFMGQYRHRWEQRILRSTLNAVMDFPEFMPGWQRWDERAFHPDSNGEMRSFADLWPKGHAPRLLMASIHALRLAAVPGVAAPLSLMFPRVNSANGTLDSSAEVI